MDRGSTDSGRLREPPGVRFAGAQHVYSLPQEAARLRSEAHPSKDGHRQIVLFREDPVSLVLFDFEAGGTLPDHVADGIVTIHVVSGRVLVRTSRELREVSAGSVLVLRPGVSHDLIAPEASQVLVSVHLNADGRS